MRLSRILRGSAIALATLGIALPHASVVTGAESSHALAVSSQSVAKVTDVTLGQGGVLKGQVVNPQGIAQSGVGVTIQQHGRQVAELRTDNAGNFAASGLRGGTYLVSTDGVVGPVRAWTQDAAPPSSAQGVLLVPAQQTVRGTNGNLLPILLNPGVAITAAVVGTILAVSIDQDDKGPSS